VQPFPENVELLAVFEIRYIDHNIVLRFYEVEDLQADCKHAAHNLTAISNKSVHHVYLVVRSIKNEQNESIGYRLSTPSPT
jgi:hypothetical protein